MSVASQDHFPHIPLKPLRQQNPHTLTAVNGERINIYGIKDVTLVYQNIGIPTMFIYPTSTVQYLLHVQGYQGHLSRDYAKVQLHYIGNHFYLKATVFDGLYDYVDYTPDFTNCTMTGTERDDAPELSIYADYIVGDTSQQEANIPKAYEAPTLPTQQEIDEHNLTHLPYRDWCKHCVQGKSKSQHHQRGGPTKQSITQIDHASPKSDNDNHNVTVLTMCESTTGLGYATVVNRRTQGDNEIYC
eukprot:2926253-Amphidinium_carterae.2